MARKHAARVAVYPDAWSQRVTIQDAYYFAKRELAAHLSAFEAAYGRGSNEGMIDAVRHLRGVSDKLDAFRRMKVREWDAAQAANQTTEGVEP